jgi:hypothetical protein
MTVRENYGDGEGLVAVDSVVTGSVAEPVSDEGVGVGLAARVTVSVFPFARSRTRETAGINKPIRMPIIAITTNNSISVKALTR